MIPDALIQQTIDRYEESAEVRQETCEKIAAKRRVEADTPLQRAHRRRRLAAAVMQRKERQGEREIASAIGAPAVPAERAAESEAAESLSGEVLERIIGGSNEIIGIAFLPLGVLAARTVGRVELPSGDLGTGFLVAPGLLLTNNHVIPSAEAAAGGRVRFNYEDDMDGNPLLPAVFALDPERLFITSPSTELDYTLIAVQLESRTAAGVPSVPLESFGFNRLSAEQGKVQQGEKINIIQHPGGRPKQLAVQGNDLLVRLDNFLQYATDTLPGSSGAPLFNNQWEVIGLHHSGVPRMRDGQKLTKDGQIWTEEMGEDAIDWIANEGIRISKVMADIQARTAALPDAQQKLALTVLAQTPGGALGGPSHLPATASDPGPPVVPPAPPEVAGAGDGEDPRPAVVRTDVISAPAGEVRIQLPLEISIRIGTPLGATSRPAVVAVSTAPAEGLLEKVSIDPDYSNRPGYNPEFLGDPVPLPPLTAAQRGLAAVNRKAPAGATGDDRHLLKYFNYSLVMNRKRRLAFFTAVNVSGEAALRQQLDKREGDAWSLDPRIAASEQTSGKQYGTPLDRGHLVRRLDPAWGPTLTAAVRANDDTFHFTNCSPQHSAFNRGKSLWQGLENFYYDRAISRGGRFCVFTGPVLSDDDPELREIQVPLAFWKIIVLNRASDGKRAAGAFVLKQDELIHPLLEEAFRPAEFRVTVDEVMHLTGLDFSHLAPFDRFGTQGGGATGVKDLESLARRPERSLTPELLRL